MADPITEVVRSPEGEERELLEEWRELWELPGQREALEHAARLLQALDEHGYLEAARATVEGGPAVQASLDRFLAESQRLRLARNLKVLFEFLSQLDLGPVLSRPPVAAGAPPSERSSPRIGFWELRRRLRDPDVSEGLDAVLRALAEVGRARRRR